MAPTKVIPVAPVNPAGNPVAAPEPTAGVVNLVNQANKPTVGEAVYTSVSDPGRRGSEAATAERDWTIRRPAPEKVENPPPVPLSKMLIEHIKSLWLASASAVQVQKHVHEEIERPRPDTSSTPGVLTNEAITYSPTKVNKTENI